jgi:hypothetical protein
MFPIMCRFRASIEIPKEWEIAVFPDGILEEMFEAFREKAESCVSGKGTYEFILSVEKIS